MARTFSPPQSVRVRPQGLVGVMRGVVLTVEADGRLWVRVPRISGADAIGPLPTVVFPRVPVVGDGVLVQAGEGRREDLIGTGLLAQGAR